MVETTVLLMNIYILIIVNTKKTDREDLGKDTIESIVEMNCKVDQTIIKGFENIKVPIVKELLDSLLPVINGKIEEAFAKLNSKNIENPPEEKKIESEVSVVKEVVNLLDDTDDVMKQVPGVNPPFLLIASSHF